MKKLLKLFLVFIIVFLVAFNTRSYAEIYKGYLVAGKIEIPKIELKYPVLNEVSKTAIENAPAILYGVGLNKVGNTVIIGHNYKNGQFFSNLKNLSVNDFIYITDDTDTKISYKIYKTFETTPEDTSFYNRETSGSREITLSTATDDATGRFIVLAKETSETAPETSSNDEYELTSTEPIADGPKRSVIKIGQSVLSEVGLVNKTDGTVKAIDKTKLKIEISTPKLVTTEASGDIKASAEGNITVQYTYSDNNKTYTYKENRIIVSDEFSTGDIPSISNSIIDLEVGKNTQNVDVSMVQGGTYVVKYPEGYTEDNYYKYEWSVEDDKIAKIDKISDTEVKISPVSKGTTKVICTITTADKKETIKKTITVNVTEEDIKKKEEPKNETKIETQNSSNLQKEQANNLTTSPKELPKAGLVNGLFISIIIITIVGLICYLRYRKIK